MKLAQILLISMVTSSPLKKWQRFGLTWKIHSCLHEWLLFPTTLAILPIANLKLINGTHLVLFISHCHSFVCGVMLTLMIFTLCNARKFLKWQCHWYLQLSLPHPTLFLLLMLTLTWNIWLTTSVVLSNYFLNTSCIRTITWPFTSINTFYYLVQSSPGGHSVRYGDAQFPVTPRPRDIMSHSLIHHKSWDNAISQWLHYFPSFFLCFISILFILNNSMYSKF